VARNHHIKTVQDYNVTVRSFPSNLTAMVFGYKEESTEMPQGATDMLNIKVVSWSLGVFTAIIERFLYGAYVGLVFVSIYGLLARRWGEPARGESRAA
jgi:LemA family